QTAKQGGGMNLGTSRLTLLLLVVSALLVSLVGFSGAMAQKAAGDQIQPPSIPGYEEMKVPSDNPMTKAKVELGKQLYYDKRLSGDGSRACYSCHLKENGLTDGKPTAIGAYEAKLPRSSPTLWNIGFHQALYWDGRSPSLAKQGMAASSGGKQCASRGEGRRSCADIAAKLNAIPGYKTAFQKAFGGPATPENIIQAISTFERTIVASDSSWVKFRSGDEAAFNDAAKRGWTIFKDKAKCVNCH